MLPELQRNTRRCLAGVSPGITFPVQKAEVGFNLKGSTIPIDFLNEQKHRQELHSKGRTVSTPVSTNGNGTSFYHYLTPYTFKELRTRQAR
ncbi:hypothetical protein M1B74_05765 [Bacteroides pyogenes]|uniref:hypothetical protein n=1 Tax=Bacteroides pyogenes TaxID=310300 RepID=UPI003B430DD5